MCTKAAKTHTHNLRYPTMRGQTLSSEAHWEILQNSSITVCCPSAHTHSWLAATDMVSMPHCGQRPQPRFCFFVQHPGWSSRDGWGLEGTIWDDFWLKNDDIPQKRAAAHKETFRSQHTHTHTHKSLWWLWDSGESDIPLTSELDAGFVVLLSECVKVWGQLSEDLRECCTAIKGSRVETVHVSTESVFKLLPIGKQSNGPSHCGLFIDQCRQKRALHFHPPHSLKETR